MGICESNSQDDVNASNTNLELREHELNYVIYSTLMSAWLLVPFRLVYVGDVDGNGKVYQRRASLCGEFAEPP